MGTVRHEVPHCLSILLIRCIEEKNTDTRVNIHNRAASIKCNMSSSIKYTRRSLTQIVKQKYVESKEGEEKRLRFWCGKSIRRLRERLRALNAEH